jgi:hypothetical protein
VGSIPSPPTTLGVAPRGALSTNTHLACDQGQKPLALIVTAGRRGDIPQFIPVLRKIRAARIGSGHPRTRPDLIPADKTPQKQPGIKACIPSKNDQDAHRKARGSKDGRPPGLDPIAYRRDPRHAVDCFAFQPVAGWYRTWLIMGTALD